MSWEIILPFLRPIEPLLTDPEISDILVNGSGRVFFEKHGQLTEAPALEISERYRQVAARNIARALGDDISEEKPLLDARLPDGSRVAAVLAPCSVSGTVLAIRKFQTKRYHTQELVRLRMFPAHVLAILERALLAGDNILLAGSTGTGKTTLMNALVDLLPASERLVVLEDTSELQIDKPNVVRLEARREQTGLPAVTIRDLLRAALRLRPDRILLGEVRGGEAFDLLQALNTGHRGTLSTIHANSARETLTRFSTCVMMAGIDLPHAAVRGQIAEALQLIVHLERREGQRRVSEVLRLQEYIPAADRFELAVLYAQG